MPCLSKRWTMLFLTPQHLQRHRMQLSWRASNLVSPAACSSWQSPALSSPLRTCTKILCLPLWRQKNLCRENQTTKIKTLAPMKVKGPGCILILTLNIEGGLYRGLHITDRLIFKSCSRWRTEKSSKRYILFCSGVNKYEICMHYVMQWSNNYSNKNHGRV